MLVQQYLVVLPYEAGWRCAIKHYYAAWMLADAAFLAYQLVGQLAPLFLLCLGNQLGYVLVAFDASHVTGDALEAFFLCCALSEPHVVAEPCALARPTLVDALHDFLVMIVGEVYVHIRQIVPEWIEEACQRYAFFHRIHISDTQQIADQA